MIKGITTIRRLASAKDFHRLAHLLDALGFEQGDTWRSPKSKGQYFLAPGGKLGIVTGEERFPSDIWVEVSDLDSANQLLKKNRIRLIADIRDTGWGSRVLVAE